MKFSTRSAAIVAALAMATTGALILSQSNADAATIATVHSGVTARLYTANGSLVNNRALGANTPWLIGKTANINGETMYQVSTNEYLSSKDSTLNGQATPTSNKTVITIGKYMQPLFRDDTGLYSNRALDYGSSWQVGKTITNNKGETYYQVSTHEFVKKSANTTLNHDVNPQYVADFGFNKDTPSTNTNTDNSHTDTTAPSTDTDTNTGSTNESTTPDVTSVQSAIIASVNAERESNGLNALTVDSRLNQAADVRAKEVDTDSGHTRPNGTDWYTSYEDAGISNAAALHVGENYFATPWNQLSQKTADRFAKVMMDNFRGEMSGSNPNNHYAELMKPDFTKIGVGVYYNPSTGELNATQEFTN